MKTIDLIKAFAELDGVSVAVSRSMLNEIKLVIGPDGLREFNPITDLALNCKARDDYEVIIEYTNHYMTAEKFGTAQGYTEFNANHSISAKVIECILKSKGLWKD